MTTTTSRLIVLLWREFRHGWVSAMLIVIVVAALAGTLTFLHASSDGIEREMRRSVRDLGSNIVILPANTDQIEYHLGGGFHEQTMPASIVEQLVQQRASLNHLIPMLERRAEVSHQGRSITSRIVGLTASIPVPGRPKSPMQRAIEAGHVQLGSEVAAHLGVDRERTNTVEILGRSFPVQRVNRQTGSWQDAAVFMELDLAQALFELPNRISRIEAVECTSEKCALTGASPHAVLQSELAAVSDEARLMRRQALAEGRRGIRALTGANLRSLATALWILLALAVGALTGMNTYWRRAEAGVLAALGYGRGHVLSVLVARSAVLSCLGACGGALVGIGLAYRCVPDMLVKTGARFGVGVAVTIQIVLVTICLATLAASVPALWAVNRQPADMIGEQS